MFTKKLIGTSVLLGALLLAVGYTTTSAEARAGIVDKIKSNSYAGIVQSFTRNKLTIKTYDGKTVEIRTTRDTDFSGTIEEGDNILVVTKKKGNILFAVSVKVLKDDPRYGHDHGGHHGGGDRDHGYKDGRDDGFNDGHDGHNDNRDNRDYCNGHSDEYTRGYGEGYGKGFDEGRGGRN
ncbi:MAG TPA: hypothetical protein VN420_01140 [Candidatus Fimivivens sp.]|nr:hypothetical protein [Candidatus Fimivivens sp.]